MSSSRAKDDIPGGQRRSYISTETFTFKFFTYRTEVDDLDITGVWDYVTNDNSLCPKGRILRENGRKLYPGANPNVNAYFVGVYDSVTFLSGFINPNESMFTVFNAEKPVYLADNKYPFDSMFDDGIHEDNEYELGAPVYTKGNIETVDGDITASAAGFPFNSVYTYNKHITINDVSGNAAAYLAFDGPNQPIVVAESNDELSYAKLKASDISSELFLYGQDISGSDNKLQAHVGEGEVTLNLQVDYAATNNSIFCNVTSTEVSIEVNGHDLSGNDEYVRLYGENGEVQISGLFNPMNARGTVVINGDGNGSTINSLLVQSNFVILTRVNYTGTAGHLSYDVTNSTLTVFSTGNETSNINYLILGSPP